MKIAFLGNFRVDYTSEMHYLKTLRGLGHEVYLLQEGIDQIEAITKHAMKSDMFFWVHTHGWHTKGMPELLQKLRDAKIPSVGYHLDLWLGIQREKDLETDCYWDIDYFFSVDEIMVNYLNIRSDRPKAFYCPAGVFKDECGLGVKQAKYEHDVIFVGSKNYHKEWPYRTQLIEFLEQTYKERFALYGRDGKGIVRGQDLNNLYASAKIVVGDTLCKNFSYPYYLSDRIFETTGRGGFIIHPYIQGIEELFVTQQIPALARYEPNYYDTKQSEIIVYPFNNFEYLKYLIDYYLIHEEEREVIRLRGMKRTIEQHTYENRLSYILDKVNEDFNAK